MQTVSRQTRDYTHNIELIACLSANAIAAFTVVVAQVLAARRASFCCFAQYFGCAAFAGVRHLALHALQMSKKMSLFLSTHIYIYVHCPLMVPLMSQEGSF